MKTAVIIWIIVTLCCFSFSLYTPVLGQGDTTTTRFNASESAIILGAKFQYGSIWAHSSELTSVAQSNPWGFSMEASRLKADEQSWQHCNCYSKVGLALGYTNFANPQVLGNAYSLVFFLEPIIVNQSRFRVAMRLGAGLAFMDNVYDEVTNPENLFYSSPVSFPLLIGLGTSYAINNQWQVNAGFIYHHISNGGMRQPNKGINYPVLSIGIDRVLFPVDLPKRVPQTAGPYPLEAYVGLFGNSRSIGDSDDTDNERRLLIGVQGGVAKQLSKLYAFNVGLEVSFDGAHREKRRQTGQDYEEYIVSPMVGNHLVFGKYRFGQQFGFYLNPPTPRKRSVFQRYTLDYYLTAFLKAGVSLKAHGHVAENMDVRIAAVF